MSSWPPFKDWGWQSTADTEWKKAMWSLQHRSSEGHATACAPSRREDAAAQRDTQDESDHAHAAHWPGRQEGAHQRRPSKAAGGSSSASMTCGTMVSADCCDGRIHCAASAFKRVLKYQADRGHSCSPQQAEQRPVLVCVPDRQSGEMRPTYTAASPGTDASLWKPRQQHSSKRGHGMHKHGAELSQVAVTISRSTLRAVMRDLAKGLADIQELRRTAEKTILLSNQPPSPQCNRPSPHDEPPGTQTSAREDGQRAQLSTTRQGSARRKISPQVNQHSAGSKEFYTAKHSRQKATQKLGAEPIGHRKGGNLPHAPPTGHPMVRWQTSLRATEPPCCNHASCPWKSPKPHSEGPSTPALQKKKSRDLSCSGKASTGVTQDLAAPQRRRALPSVRRMAEESSDPGDAQLHAQLHTESKGSHQQETHLDHKQVGTPLLAAALIAEQQGLVPASRAQPSQQHLRQRYLPVYSVFDEKESTAGGTQELIRARLIRQCTPRAADTPELASEAASQQQFGDKFSSHAPLTSTQEDVLRAALQRFAMRVT